MEEVFKDASELEVALKADEEGVVSSNEVD